MKNIMYTKLYKSIILLLIVFFFGSCNDFEEINTDPDKPATASAPWLANHMLTEMTSVVEGEGKSFTEAYHYAKYMLFTERKEGFQYNYLGRANFTNILTPLKNIKPMVEYADELTPEVGNSYKALAHFIRSWQFFQLTMRVGDIPYSEAIKGDEGIIKPKYDLQKDVFLGILDELDEADALFAKGANISGDFIFKGDVDKWRRLVNSFQLYVLINLHEKTSDSDLHVIEKFKEVSLRPLMRDFHDNFALHFTTSKGYTYPWSNTGADINPFTQYTMLSTTFIDLLKQNNDRRLFYVAEPAEALIEQGKSASNFDAYIGVEPSDEFSITLDKKNSNMYSDLNKRYVESATAEPVGFLCHWDVEFLLAEASVRGWISNDAQTHYANGIKSSMNFYANYVSDTYNHGVVLDQSYINSYPETVSLTGTTENMIKQIVTQKYLSGFFHNDYQAWFEFRRTGYPEFVLNPNSNSNPTDNTKFPTKWLYPQNEINYNSENLNEALKRQYNGSDDFNGIMWVLKK